MNIVGWATGVDGQLPGFTSNISFFLIGLLGLQYSTDIVSVASDYTFRCCCVAYLDFFHLNFFPQSIMPGL